MKKTILPVTLLVFLGVLMFDLAVLSSHHWNAQAFILERSPEVPLEQGWNIGYDGQWSYLIALDPLGAGPLLDEPGYRYQRILYPLLARVLGLGQPALIPWAMLAVNLFAAAASSWLLATLMARRGVSPWLALVFVFSFGYLLTIRMDLLEPLAICLALAGWLAYESKRPILATALFALSGLTKEIGLVFPAALAAWELSRKNLCWSAICGFGSFTPYLLWRLVLFFEFGNPASQADRSRLNLVPFSGMGYLDDPMSRVMVGLWVLLPVFLVVVWSVWRFIRGPGRRFTSEMALVLAHALLIALLPVPTWEDPIAVLRVGLGFLVALLIYLASSYRRLLPFAAALWGPSGLLLWLIPGML